MGVLANTTDMRKLTIRKCTDRFIEIIAELVPVKVGDGAAFAIEGAYVFSTLDSGRKSRHSFGAEGSSVPVGAADGACEGFMAAEMTNQELGVHDGPIEARVIQFNKHSGLRRKGFVIFVKHTAIALVQIGHQRKVHVQFLPSIRKSVAEYIPVNPMGHPNTEAARWRRSSLWMSLAMGIP